MSPDSHSRILIARDASSLLLHIQKLVDFLVIKTRQRRDWVTTHRMPCFLFQSKVSLYSPRCPGIRHRALDCSELDTILPFLSLEFRKVRNVPLSPRESLFALTGKMSHVPAAHILLTGSSHMTQPVMRSLRHAIRHMPHMESS